MAQSPRSSPDSGAETVPGPVADLARVLRLDRRTWDGIAEVEPVRAMATVLGGWLLMAWHRFGVQGLSAPRVGVRFVLVGVYGWLGLTAVLVLAGALLHRRTGSTATVAGRAGSTATVAGRVLPLSALAHQPLLVTGFVLLFAQVLPIPWLTTGVTVLALGFWMPAMLGAAMASALDTDPARAAAVTAVGYLAWAGTAGRFLLDRVGHLV